jgi:hypothetical protein
VFAVKFVNQCQRYLSTCNRPIAQIKFAQNVGISGKSEGSLTGYWPFQGYLNHPENNQGTKVGLRHVNYLA